MVEAVARIKYFSAMSRFVPVATDLALKGWAICPDFLPPDTVAALFDAAQHLWAAHAFRRAGVGRATGYAIQTEVRGDFICWLDEHAPHPALKDYWREIEQLRLTLNRELFLSLVSYEAHFAVYPPGAAYRCHLDRFTTADERMISCALYLNQAWRPEDQGQLRLHIPGTPVDILPCAGTLAALRSDMIMHEVLPAKRPRYSLTGWFKRRSSQPFRTA
jgi:SM-20-related protein